MRAIRRAWRCRRFAAGVSVVAGVVVSGALLEQSDGAMCDDRPQLDEEHTVSRAMSRCELTRSSVIVSMVAAPCWFSVVVGGRPDLASEDTVADDGVEQHQREDEEALAPEHEGETGMGCGGFFDRDRERDHVGPERDRQGAERRCENQRDHVIWHFIPATPYALGGHERRDDADRREDKQI